MANPTHTHIRPAVAAHRPFLKPFTDLNAAVARREGWREGQGFTVWMEACSAAMAGAALGLLRDAGSVTAGERWALNEARYMALVKRMRHPTETLANLAEMQAVMVAALEAEPADFVGPVFTELAANAGMGQFFTPWELTKLMANVTLGDAPALLQAAKAAGGNAVFLQEPAVGVGGMVLAANTVMREAGLVTHREAHWVAVDRDWHACCGAYLQLSLCAVSAVVVHGDSLTLESWTTLPTPMAALYPKRRPVAAETPVPATVAAPAPPARQRPAQQLDLFAMGEPQL